MDGEWLSSRRKEKEEGGGGGGRLKKKEVDFSQYRHVPTASSSSEGDDDDDPHDLIASKPAPSSTPLSPPLMITIPRKPGAPPGGLHSLPKRKLPPPALPPVPMGSGGRDAIKKKREELRRKQQEKEEQEEEERRQKKKVKTEDEARKEAAPAAASSAAAAAIAAPPKRGRLRRARDDDSSDDDDDLDVLGGSTSTSSSVASSTNRKEKRPQENVPAAYSDDDLMLMLGDGDSSREAEGTMAGGGVNGFKARKDEKEEKEKEREKKEAPIMVYSSEDEKKVKGKKKEKKVDKEVLEILDEDEEEAAGGGGESNDDDEGEGGESEWEDEEGIRAQKTVKACELISKRLMEEIRQWGQKHAKDRLDLTHMEDDDQPAAAPAGGGTGTSKSSSSQGQGRASSQKTERVQADILATACPGVDFKPYQLVGINWLFLLHQLDLDLPRSLLPEEAFQGRWAKEPLRLNGVLADDMGLGKTAQTIAFLAYLRALSPRKYTHLIIVPASVLSNWENEFEKFAPDVSVFVYHGSAKQRGELRAQYEEEQQRQARVDRKEGREGGREGGGFVTDVVLATYTYWEKETSDVDRKFLNKIPLEYMVLDEGHSIKNVKSQRFQRLRKQKAARRLLLTGTPLQNDVREVLALLAFLNPRILSFHGADGATVDGFWNSLVEGGGEGGKEGGKEGGGEKEAIERLKRIFAPFVLRRLKMDVLDQLSNKTQVVEMVKLTEGQRGVYESVTQRHFQRLEETANRKVIQALTLPILMLPEGGGEEEGGGEGEKKKKKKEKGKGKKGGKEEQEEQEEEVEVVGKANGDGHGGKKKRLLRSADSTRPSSSSSSSSTQDAAALVAAATSSLSDKDAGHIFTEWRKAANHSLLLRRRFSDASIVEMAGVLHQTGYFGWECSVGMVQKELEGLCDFELHAIAQDERRLAHLTLPVDALFDSCKCQRLRVLLPALLEEGHRVLIFSTWTRVLDILGALLEEALQISFLRLDGSTPVGERQEMIDRFNALGSEIPVFLLSTRAGGLGINLTSADTVILHDPDWNPSLDAQAVDRCHRIGQTKPVTVYKLVAEGTVDERIYRRAVGKKEKTEALLESGGGEEGEEGGGGGGEGGGGVGGGKEISRIVQSEFLAYQQAQRRAKEARAAEEEEESSGSGESGSEGEGEGEDSEEEDEVQVVAAKAKTPTPQRRHSSVLEDIVSTEDEDDEDSD